jgi:NADPH-dependent 2,4-dienoyl-CoA reductase/sulfur reductase-like enzyme
VDPEDLRPCRPAKVRIVPALGPLHRHPQHHRITADPRPQHLDSGSYWLADYPPASYEEAEALPDVDVAVVGGGIAGITTAYLLKQAGRTVALVEARRLLDGVTRPHCANRGGAPRRRPAAVRRLGRFASVRRYAPVSLSVALLTASLSG